MNERDCIDKRNKAFGNSRCVEIIKASFLTIANELNFNQNHAPIFTAFSTNEERLYWQYDKKKEKCGILYRSRYCRILRITA